MDSIPVRVGIQQRVLPSYRVTFFDALAEVCTDGLGVFAGDPRKDEALDCGARLTRAQFTRGLNLHLFHGAFYLCVQVGLLKWLAFWQPRVLIMETNPRYPLSRAAMRWVRACGGKVIGWGLGSPPPVGKCSDLRLGLWRGFVKHFDALITYSQSGALEYSRLGFPEHLIFTAPNAVAPKPKHPNPQRPLQYRFDRPVILFIGRLQARKRVDVLLRACALLKTDPRPLLQVVGDGPMRHDLERLAAEIYPDTRFFGAQHGAELTKLLREADLFVLPGTGGLAVQQAMSFGLPVIVGQMDGTQSDLVRAENGWTLSDPSPETLAHTIHMALEDIPGLRQKGNTSYRIVSEEVNLESMVAAFQKAILRVLEG